MPPNIDFYVLLDNSPSMALPATTAGITQMENLTPKQATGGCAFACHQASTNNGDTAGNPCTDGTAPTQSGGLYCAASHGAQIDNYKLARNNSITLRLDELNSAVDADADRVHDGQFDTIRDRRRPTDFRSTRWIPCGRSASTS